MASGIFAILDDIATLLDDAAVMSKVAAKKTAGLLGDDLAVNAEKATGFKASRELPVIWAISKGSLLNKLIILPVAFLLSAYMSWLIVPILLIGGAYLSFEGVEKIYDWITGKGHQGDEIAVKVCESSGDLLQKEKVKIKAAIRTDFILSIEIVVIALETVMQQSFAVQVMVVSFIALLTTAGVYGLVAFLVRMDDMGVFLIERAQTTSGAIAKSLAFVGKLLVSSLPKMIRLLSVIGTIAMLLVGGGMYVHNIEFVHHVLQAMPALLAELAVGLVLGSVLVAAMHFIRPGDERE